MQPFGGYDDFQWEAWGRARTTNCGKVSGRSYTWPQCCSWRCSVVVAHTVFNGRPREDCIVRSKRIRELSKKGIQTRSSNRRVWAFLQGYLALFLSFFLFYLLICWGSPPAKRSFSVVTRDCFFHCLPSLIHLLSLFCPRCHFQTAIFHMCRRENNRDQEREKERGGVTAIKGGGGLEREKEIRSSEIVMPSMSNCCDTRCFLRLLQMLLECWPVEVQRAFWWRWRRIVTVQGIFSRTSHLLKWWGWNQSRVCQLDVNKLEISFPCCLQFLHGEGLCHTYPIARDPQNRND